MTDAEVLDRLRACGLVLTQEALFAWLQGLAAAPANPFGFERLGAFPVAEDPALGEALLARIAAVPIPDPGAPADRSSRFAALRLQLRSRGLAGVLVPRADAYQGEAVPVSAQRLAWLTGFTGSAGSAVILLETAALFVDGRYTLQARAEVPSDLVSVCHLVEEPPAGWLKTRLSEGGRIGYDPWLHTVEAIEKLRRELEGTGIDLAPVEDNPVDAVWVDRPPPPLAPVVEQPARFAGRSSGDKRREVAQQLRTAQADALVLTQPDAIAWVLNIRGGDVPFTPVAHCLALCYADGSVDWFIDRRKVPPGLMSALAPDGTVRLFEESAFGAALDHLARAQRRVLLDPQSCAAWISDRLTLGGGRPVRKSDPVAVAKARKNRTEVEGARAAHRRDGVALTRFLHWLEETLGDGDPADAAAVTESLAADRLLAFRGADPSFWGPSFETIAATGPNAAIVHYRVTPATDRPLRQGDLFLLDSGGQYRDGTTDVTRTVAVVAAINARARRDYTLVLNAHIALATTLFPKGTTGTQLDAIARRGLWAHGLDYDHGTGHGVGSFLSVHEGPQRISKIPVGPALEPGMILSNEPGYYRAGALGIRLENLVLVQRCEGVGEDGREMLGFETLTLAPFDRRLIEPSLLDEAARAWLNGYHARVYASLADRLDERTRDWLASATRPIAAAAVAPVDA